MLQPFLVQSVDELVSRAKAKASARRWSSASTPALESRVAQLLARLQDAALLETRTVHSSEDCNGAAGAIRHARDLLERGGAASQIVHDYGDLRDAVTELAAAKGVAVGAEELGALGRCLDGAAAEAVAAYTRIKDESTSHREVERLGQLGHDLRTHLQTALLSFRVLETGGEGVEGSAGGALGRSLLGLRELIDTRLAETHLAATTRVPLAAFVHEVAIAAQRDAEHREIRLTIEPCDPALAVDVDPQLLASALMSLLQNALKYTRAHGCVTLRARSENGRALVEVEDECGGMKTGGPAERRALGDRRGSDRPDPGRGLSSSRRAVQANGGEMQAHDLPGKGCIFDIRLPLAAPLDAGSRIDAPRSP